MSGYDDGFDIPAMLAERVLALVCELLPGGSARETISAPDRSMARRGRVWWFVLPGRAAAAGVIMPMSMFMATWSI